MKKVVITIDPVGNPTIEAHGFNGVGCAAATDAIEKALTTDGKSIQKNFKPEYSQGSAQQQQTVKTW